MLEFLAVLFWGLLLLGPFVYVARLAATSPAQRVPDPVRPVTVALTVYVLFVWLTPVWSVMAGETGFDPLGILEPDAGASLWLYLAAPFALAVAWRTNGSSRATKHPVLTWLQGIVFVLLTPSFMAFVAIAVAYDEPHT